MAGFLQPINRESQLQAILNGYEQLIDNSEWLAEAVQKDGIQNAWDARVDKHRGAGWKCEISYVQDYRDNNGLIIISDRGTTGLIGEIPQNVDHLVRILKLGKDGENLAYFLSSDWSKKSQADIGSRGRGKMLFLGASRISSIYFDSKRLTDNNYIFGKTYMDQNKQVMVEVFQGKEAEKQRLIYLGNGTEGLTKAGTRIFIPYPKQELVKAIISETIVPLIQKTWWEILQKYNAEIIVSSVVGGHKKERKVTQSDWLPVEHSGIKAIDIYENIAVESGMRIKRLSLCYLGNKEVPISYHGIAVQRGGMMVELRSLSKIHSDIPAGSIYGSVEFDLDLDRAMKQLEGPEHYTFSWYKGVAPKVNKIIKFQLTEFARKYRLLEEREQTSKDQHEAEIVAQKDLNKLARELGLKGLGTGRPPGPPPPPPGPIEKIRISVPDFETPYETGRVDFNQSITGLYAVPINEYSTKLQVLIRAWVFRDDGTQLRDFSMEQTLTIPVTGQVKIGWEDVVIDPETFQTGKYNFRARMISLEDKTLDDGTEVEKGDVLYHDVTKSFWVNEDPPEKGFFEVRRVDSEKKNKYIWAEEGQNVYYLNWNGKHPLLIPAVNNKSLLEEQLRREGTVFLLGIFLTHTQLGENQRKDKYSKEIQDLRDEPFIRQLSWVVERRSEYLWGAENGNTHTAR